MIENKCMTQSCATESSQKTFWKISLLQGWSNAGTGFLESLLMPHAYQCSR